MITYNKRTRGTTVYGTYYVRKTFFLGGLITIVGLSLHVPMHNITIVTR